MVGFCIFAGLASTTYATIHYDRPILILALVPISLLFGLVGGFVIIYILCTYFARDSDD